MPNTPIICALDMLDIDRAVEMTRMLRGKVAMVKLGLESFVRYGPPGVQRIAELGVPVFLDLKLCDIPNTVEKTVNAIKMLQVAMFTIHVSGGKDMIKTSMDALSDVNILPVGVTVLTSMDDTDLVDIGIHRSTASQVIRLAGLAISAGLKTLVCSAYEVGEIRRLYPDVTLVVPGIRIDKGTDDQKRVMTPKEAILEGADYLVVGRPITQSSDPIAVVDKILKLVEDL